MNLWQLFQKLRPFVRPYRILVVATLILTLIGSFTAQVNALTLQYAVDSINRLVEQGQGLTEGLHILITISVILLSKEIISDASTGPINTPTMPNNSMAPKIETKLTKGCILLRPLRIMGRTMLSTIPAQHPKMTIKIAFTVKPCVIK